MRLFEKRSSGVTLIEVLVILATIFVLLCIVLPNGSPEGDYKKENCMHHLKALGQNYASWAQDHNGRFPFAVSTNEGGTMEFTRAEETFMHFQVLSFFYITPERLTCPSDNARTPAQRFPISNSNLSFFINLNAGAPGSGAILSGDRNITGGSNTSQGWITFGANNSVAWETNFHKKTGNILLADGSVTNITSRRLQEKIQGLGTNQLRLLIP
jgi:prepilin-type processing-associated H-X9-DG protein